MVICLHLRYSSSRELITLYQIEEIAQWQYDHDTLSVLGIESLIN